MSFSADFFAGNRERLRQLFTGTAPIVLTGAGRLQQATDEGYAFHQDRNFWYLTGIDEPEIVLVMDKGKEYLILPERSDVQNTFDGSFAYEEMARISGIETILTPKEGWKLLGGRLKRAQHVATLAANPKYIEVFGLYSNPARAELIAKMKECNDSLELLDLRMHLARMRMVKQPLEITAIRQAIDVTCASLKDALRPKRLEKYRFEYELEAEVAYGFRKRGAAGHAFAPIVASGERACTLHYLANRALLDANDMVILDVGAEWDHYAADISRTVHPAANPSKRQRQVHETVIAVQDYAFNLQRPGAKVADNERLIEHFMGEKLRELGLIKTIDKDNVRTFFPHATSHYLGADVHDVGDYDRPLEPGVVLTVEPGIYIPEEGIGVRIEDDILITETGYEILSDGLPRELA